MALSFTSDARPPSNTQLLPNRFLRPAFGELYGFDADADSGSAAPAFSNVYALSLDGSNDYADCGVLTELHGASTMSLSFWFKSDASGAGPSMGSRTGSTNQWGFLRAGGVNYVQIVTGGAGKYFSYTSPADTEYHHYVLTFSSGSINFYIDGAAVSISLLNIGSGVVNVLHSASVSFDLGRNATFYSDGLLDEVSLFDTELSSENVTAMYNSGAPTDVSSLSPLGWWRCGDNDSGTGTTITDQGSGGNHATLTNGPTFSTAVPLGPLVLPSITNSYALSFDGSNDYVDTGIPTDLQGSATMSLSFWFKSDTSGVGPSIGCRSAFANQWGFLRAGSANYVQIMTGSNGKYFSYSSPSDTNYHHYLITFNAGTIEFFLDGSPVSVSFTNSGNGTAATLHSDSVSFDIGRSQNFYSDGLMDEVSLFDKVLSQREITAMYNSGTPNDISSLSPVGWYRNGDNDGGTGTTITDQGSAGNNGTLTNGPTFSTTVP